MAAPTPCDCLVFLIDPLHASAAAALRHALSRFANLLTLGTTEPEHSPHVGLATVTRSGGSVQLQVVYKPSPFVFRDFQAAVTRLRDNEAWASPDTRKLLVALRTLIQHLTAAKAASASAAVADRAPSGSFAGTTAEGPTNITRVVVVAHSFTIPSGALLSRVLEDAAQALVSVSFVSLNSEQSLERFRSAAAGGEAGAVPAAGGTIDAAGRGIDASKIGKRGPEQTNGSPARAGAVPMSLALSLEETAAAASAAFAAAASSADNGDHVDIVARPLELERLYTSWAHQLLQPPSPPEVMLVLPSAAEAYPPTAAAAVGSPGWNWKPVAAAADGKSAPGDVDGGGGGGGNTATVPGCSIRCLMTCQLSYIHPRCTPCPLCLCHGLPALRLPSRGPRPCICRVHPGTLLPPDAALPDPLTVRLGAAQELRLSGRAGGPPPGVVDEGARWPFGPTSSGPAEPVRLVVERIVQPAQIDDAVLYGWPQVLTPAFAAVDERRENADAADASSENRDLAAASGSAGPIASLAALAQVLQQQHVALLASASASLCDGPAGRPPPAPTSLKQWYLLVPGPGCFLLRQVACREQLVPLRPPPADPSATSPEALDTARRALQALPGWPPPPPLADAAAPAALDEPTATAPALASAAIAAAAVHFAAPVMAAVMIAPAPAGVADMQVAVREEDGAGDTAAGDRAAGGDPGAPGAALTVTVTADTRTIGSENAGSGGTPGQPLQQVADGDTGSAFTNAPGNAASPGGAAAPVPAMAAAAGAAGAAEVAAGPGATPPQLLPPPGTAGSQEFVPLALSSGCHELLTALLRDSVRLTPRHPQPSGTPGAMGAAGPQAATGMLPHVVSPTTSPFMGRGAPGPSDTGGRGDGRPSSAAPAAAWNGASGDGGEGPLQPRQAQDPAQPPWQDMPGEGSRGRYEQPGGPARGQSSSSPAVIPVGSSCCMTGASGRQLHQQQLLQSAHNLQHPQTSAQPNPLPTPHQQPANPPARSRISSGFLSSGPRSMSGPLAAAQAPSPASAQAPAPLSRAPSSSSVPPPSRPTTGLRGSVRQAAPAGQPAAASAAGDWAAGMPQVPGTRTDPASGRPPSRGTGSAATGGMDPRQLPAKQSHQHQQQQQQQRHQPPQQHQPQEGGRRSALRLAPSNRG